MADNAGNRGLFCDLGGTLVKLDENRDLPADARGNITIELLPGVAETLRPIRDHLIFIVTNQRSIKRGRFTREQVEAAIAELDAQLGDILTACEICPHGPEDGCGCRKPAPGMVTELAATYGVDLPNRPWSAIRKSMNNVRRRQAWAVSCMPTNSSKPVPSAWILSRLKKESRQLPDSCLCWGAYRRCANRPWTGLQPVEDRLPTCRWSFYISDSANPPALLLERLHHKASSLSSFFYCNTGSSIGCWRSERMRGWKA